MREWLSAWQVESAPRAQFKASSMCSNVANCAEIDDAGTANAT